jgi:endonuclease YncB( thermonuclease family)
LALAASLAYGRRMPALSDAAYQKLLARLQRLLEKAKRHKSTAAHLVETYWTVGQLIDETGSLESASWGDRIIKNLSEDLSIDTRTLQRSIAFFQQYDELPQTPLGWSHYRELLTLSDPDERAFYEKLAIDEALSRDRLVMAIESDVFSEKNAPKRRARLKRPDDLRYLFEASLLRVIDGDTMVFDIDVGFEVVKRQRVRLAKVNAFSAESQKGREATNFAANKLSFADRIILQTHRADLHGRYVAHVFYSTRDLSFFETFESGRYLNQQLLDQKLAMIAKR